MHSRIKKVPKWRPFNGVSRWSFGNLAWAFPSAFGVFGFRVLFVVSDLAIRLSISVILAWIAQLDSQLSSTSPSMFSFWIKLAISLSNVLSSSDLALKLPRLNSTSCNLLHLQQRWSLLHCPSFSDRSLDQLSISRSLSSIQTKWPLVTSPMKGAKFLNFPTNKSI